MATTIDKSADREEAIEKLWSLIEDIRVAMLTTLEDGETLRSRPMATQEAETDGDLWFFTAASSPKSQEVRRDQHVNLSYASPKENRYVSVSGTAQLVFDRQKAEELWKPAYKAWFPGGLEDPELALLKVTIEKAEYWDAPSSAMVHLIGFVKATVTGKQYNPGENKEIILGN